MRKHFSRSRRSFFKKLALLGGSAALTGLTGRKVDIEKNGTKTTDEAGKGYRMTPHIQNYYRKADN